MNSDGRLFSAFAEQKQLHLPRQILASPLVGQVEPVFIDQHGLLLHPVSPGLLADFFPDAFAQRAGVGRKIHTFCFGAELDAVNETCHVMSSFGLWGVLR